tara:strand:- start:1341 stop:1745 length:405 start_codon:yes stop_codon:yes gene_type:complete
MATHDYASLDIREKIVFYCRSNGRHGRGGVEVSNSGDFKQASQKNFSIILQAIGLRCQPHVIVEPYTVLDLNDVCDLKGRGTAFVLGFEHADAFSRGEDKLWWIRENLDNLILYDGGRLRLSEKANAAVGIYAT